VLARLLGVVIGTAFVALFYLPPRSRKRPLPAWRQWLARLDERVLGAPAEVERWRPRSGRDVARLLVAGPPRMPLRRRTNVTAIAFGVTMVALLALPAPMAAGLVAVASCPVLLWMVWGDQRDDAVRQHAADDEL
jgi:hypothetical protein